MRKLEKLILKNFQCWTYQEICFNQGLNIIIGDSDSGKSSILRAIISCFNGRIDINWIQHGAKELCVEMWFTDGSKAIRTRSKKSNTVSFIDKDGKKHEWERIGTGLPEEYLRMLGATEIKLPDGTTIDPCINTQIDQHFFLSISDNAKAKVLGSISGLDMIDGALGIITTEARETQNKIKQSVLRIEEIKIQKDSFLKEISNAKVLIHKFDGLDRDLILKVKKIKNISELDDKIEKVLEVIEAYNYRISKNEKVLVALKSNFANLSKVDQLERVSKLAQGITFSGNEIEFHGKQDKIASSNLSVLNSALKILEKVKENSILIKKLEQLERNIECSRPDDLLLKEEEIDDSLKELRKKQKEIFKDIEQCPLCGQTIGHNHE